MSSAPGGIRTRGLHFDKVASTPLLRKGGPIPLDVSRKPRDGTESHPTDPERLAGIEPALPPWHGDVSATTPQAHMYPVPPAGIEPA